MNQRLEALQGRFGDIDTGGKDPQTHGRKRPFDHKGRDWSDAARSQGLSAATRSWKEEEGSSLELSEGAWPCQNLDSGLPNSRTEQTDFGCFKPASLWCLLMAATGNSYGQ